MGNGMHRSSAAEEHEAYFDELGELEESLGLVRSRVHPGRHSVPAMSEAGVDSQHRRDHRQRNLPDRSEAAPAPLPMEADLGPNAPSVGRGDNRPAPRPERIGPERSYSRTQPNRVLKTQKKCIKTRAYMKTFNRMKKDGASVEAAKAAAKLAYASAA